MRQNPRPAPRSPRPPPRWSPCCIQAIGSGVRLIRLLQERGLYGGPSSVGAVSRWVGLAVFCSPSWRWLALSVAAWAFAVVPAVPPLPRARQTVVDSPAAWASHLPAADRRAGAATPRCRSGSGFLPVFGATAAWARPPPAACRLRPGRLRRSRSTPGGPRPGPGTDHRSHPAITAGLALTAQGLAAAMLPGITGVNNGLWPLGTVAGTAVTPSAFTALPDHPEELWARPWAPQNSPRLATRRSLHVADVPRHRLLRPDTHPRAAFSAHRS